MILATFVVIAATATLVFWLHERFGLDPGWTILPITVLLSAPFYLFLDRLGKRRRRGISFTMWVRLTAIHRADARRRRLSRAFWWTVWLWVLLLPRLIESTQHPVHRVEWVLLTYGLGPLMLMLAPDLERGRLRRALAEDRLTRDARLKALVLGAAVAVLALAGVATLDSYRPDLTSPALWAAFNLAVSVPPIAFPLFERRAVHAGSSTQARALDRQAERRRGLARLTAAAQPPPPRE